MFRIVLSTIAGGQVMVGSRDLPVGTCCLSSSPLPCLVPTCPPGTFSPWLTPSPITTCNLPTLYHLPSGPTPAWDMKKDSPVPFWSCSSSCSGGSSGLRAGVGAEARTRDTLMTAASVWLGRGQRLQRTCAELEQGQVVGVGAGGSGCGSDPKPGLGL